MHKSVLLSAVAGVLVLTGSMQSREALAQSDTVLITTVDLDIVPSEMAKFIEAAKKNGAGTIKEPGCREFNIQVLANNPNHVFVYEVYDNQAALDAHLASDHFNKFLAATANMITNRQVRAMSPIALNSKAH